MAEPEGLKAGGGQRTPSSMGSQTPCGLGDSVQGGDCRNQSSWAGLPLAEKCAVNK